MSHETPEAQVQIFSTAPQSADAAGEEYRRRVADVARWSEEAGCTGILVYSDNRLVDPWLVSQMIVESTSHLAPLVAVQPVYIHPYAVATKVASFAHTYRRRVYLNMVAGGFKNDLDALCDGTPHDRRYDRLTEYTTIVKELARGDGPVTFDGEFYRVKNLKLSPPVFPDLLPGIFVSGSSDAGRAASRALGATAVKYPKPIDEEEEAASLDVAAAGVRVGIVTREDGEQAWRVARERFPEDRRGQVKHELAMKVSDSEWHQQLSEMAQEGISERNPYWLHPFENYKSMCPYLVGSYDRVGEEISRYLSLGYRTFILDIPPSEEELRHIGAAFSLAREVEAV